MVEQQHVLHAMKELGLDNDWEVTRSTSADQVYEGLFAAEVPDEEDALFRRYDVKDQRVLSKRSDGASLPLLSQTHRSLIEHSVHHELSNTSSIERGVRLRRRTSVASCDEVFVDPNERKEEDRDMFHERSVLVPRLEQSIQMATRCSTVETASD